MALKFILTACVFLLVYLCCVCRFSDGLRTLGVLQKIRHHPEAFRPVLCYSPGTLTAEIMDDLFAIRWSEMGSNNRADENRVVAYWRDYLQDAGGVILLSVMVWIVAFTLQSVYGYGIVFKLDWNYWCCMLLIPN